MAEENWSVGVVVDERATTEQQQALTAIASGRAGGPMGALSGLVGTFLGVDKGPFRFEAEGLRRAVSIPGLLEQAAEGVPGVTSGEPLFIDNTLHPAGPRLALARATRSRLQAFGLAWSDASGRNNGHFAPFDWRG